MHILSLTFFIPLCAVCLPAQMFMYGGTTTERLKTLYPVNAALWLRFSLLMLLKPQPYFYSSPLLDAVAHVGFGVALGVAMRPIGWLACGVRPASRGRPGRKQEPWKKA